MASEINEILDAYNANTLREMAEVAGLDITQGSKKLPKELLIAKLRTDFFTTKRVLNSLARLNEREQTVLNRLLLRGGKAPTRSFKRELVRAGLATEGEEPKRERNYYYYRSEVPYADGYVGSPIRSDSTVFEDIIARLTYHGLVFSQGVSLNSGGTAFKLRFHPAAILYIPTVVRQHLPEPEPLPVGQSDWQPAYAHTADPTLFLRDLYLYWDFIRWNETPLLQTGLVGKRSLKAINDLLLQPDPLLDDARREDETGRLYLLRQLLEALKLLRQERGNLERNDKDTLHIPPFWRKTTFEQISACLNVWPQLAGYKDLANDKAAQYGARFTTARQVILTVLKTTPANRWLDRVELLEQIWAHNLDFLFPDHSGAEGSGHNSYYYSRHSSTYFYGKTADLLRIFEQFETEFVNNCLTQILYPLGIVELGGEAAAVEGGQIKSWQAFRLTPFGLAALGKSSALPSTTHTGKLIIQPNFQIMAIGPVSLDILAQLDIFADREQADRGVFQYRLSRGSVYRAQQLSYSTAEITQFLTQVSEVELTQNVRRSLEEWGSHHERIVFRRGVSLMQAASPGLLAELWDQAPTGNLLARPIAPDVALIKNKQPQKLISVLVDQGMLPAVSGANPEAADQSVLIQADGTIQPVHAVPSLHLRGRLAQIADEDGTGRWHLTPASVRRAGGSRAKISRLLEEVSKLQRGSLPEHLVTQIKAWGGYYGQAAAETVTLLEFSDPATLKELGQHPELQPYLTPFPAGERALALVPAEHLALVKERLACFGIQVKDSLSG